MVESKEENASLRQRVNDFLRSRNATTNRFCVASINTQATDADLTEYHLKRAERELSEIQARVDELRRKLERAQGRSNVTGRSRVAS